MMQWDLTNKIGHFLDRHLVFPLLEFLTLNKLYNKKELLAARHELAKHTMMLDYAIDLYRQMYPGSEPPEDLLKHRDSVLKSIKKSQDETSTVRKMFEESIKNENLMEKMINNRDGRVLLDYLVQEFKFQLDWMGEIYVYARYQYQCGNYSACSEIIYICQLLLPSTDKNTLNLLWGKLASEILTQNWEAALNDFTRLKDFIDSNNFGSALVALQQRTWLIHWSLFVFFNHIKGQDLIIDMLLFQQQYLNAVQTTCPHILRYLTSAVITNKQRPSVMKELVKVIQQESYAYRDPITEFVECLYVNFDFDGAQQKLRECEQVLKNDFFLVSCLNSFIENARMVIFETFCCIHQCISITMLADKLNMTPEAAEKWIVNLIRNARLDAKIDSRLGHVVMGINTLSPYQQLIEKTKVLSFRAQLLATNLEKKVASNLPERIPYWAASEF